MINVMRRSQMVGLMAMDSVTASRFETMEEAWIDQHGRVVYLAGQQGYLPLEQVAVIGADAVLTYSRTLYHRPQEPLYPLYKRVIRSPLGEDVGWIDDFIFDWQTGEVLAYILGGDIAAPFGERAVLYPEDVILEAEAVVLREGAQDHLKSESEGLKGFLTEKSQQVRAWVHTLAHRLQSLVSPQDPPEVVRVKVKDVSRELTPAAQHNATALQEATEFLQDQWQSLQQSISRATHRAKRALGTAWKQITGQS